jgi:2,3-bisphosphoglycerate-independent phosphoglycerate mutase
MVDINNQNTAANQGIFQGSDNRPKVSAQPVAQPVAQPTTQPAQQTQVATQPAQPMQPTQPAQPDPTQIEPIPNLLNSSQGQTTPTQQTTGSNYITVNTDSNPDFSIEPLKSGQPLTSGQNTQYQGVKPVVLLILDGWGIGPNNAGNAITKANTPNLDKYWISFPHTQLAASGEAVGLPHGQDGNTETGHLNIGAGHIVYQDLPRINMAIADGTFNNNQSFLNAFAHVKKHNSTLHVMGLIGAGGVHSNIEHLYALLNLCKQQGLTKVYIHGFTDGRDSPPTSGINYVQQIMDRCKSLGIGQLATLMGRYYGMDRDKKWDRIEKAYNALTVGSDRCTNDPIGAMKEQYDQNITDEFIEPISICNGDGTHRTIQDNDAAIFFNYRVDRPRELTRAFVQPDFEQGIKHEAFDPYQEKYEKTNIQKKDTSITFQRQKVINNLYFVTMTRYEEQLPVDVAFPPQFVKHPICKIFAEKSLRQLRTTETEKERFVTYYMNGQSNDIYPGEDRIILPSKGAKSYDQVPEMSAYEIGHHIIQSVQENRHDIILSNICNGDMVGHTGNLEAAIKACEVVDDVVGQIVKAVFKKGGVVLISADHGNVEEMINNQTGEIDTEHSIYPVPLFIIGQQFMGQTQMLPTGILADIAPTMLKIMGIPKPESMTGRALI